LRLSSTASTRRWRRRSTGVRLNGPPRIFKELLEKLKVSVAHVLELMESRQDWGWDQAPYADVEKIKRARHRFKPVIIRASIQRLGDVALINEQDISSATLRDVRSGDQISTGPMADPILENLQDLRHQYAVLDYLGFPVAFIGAYLFIMLDMRPPETPFQIVRASPEEIEATEEFLEDLQQQGVPPFRWLLRQVIDLVRVRGVEPGCPLDEMLQAVVLQAISNGRVDNTNGRLHSLVIGSPGGGKKLLTDAASILNLTFEHASHKLTAAGIISRARLASGNVYMAEPGLLPLAHRGVLALEDFHSLSPGRLSTVLGQLSQAMEDGEVYDSTAAKTKLRANTGVHFDLNRASDLFPGKKKPEDDFDNLPMNVLSRFDVAYEYPSDTQRMFDVAATMLEKTEIIGPDTRKRHRKRVRRLRLVVAALRERIPDVVVPGNIARQAGAFMHEIERKYRGFDAVYRFLGMFPTRMANSIRKIASAHARAHARNVMTEDDLKIAELYMKRKLEVIERILTGAGQPRPAGKQGSRYEAAQGAFGEDEWTADEYEEATGASQTTA